MKAAALIVGMFFPVFLAVPAAAQSRAENRFDTPAFTAPKGTNATTAAPSFTPDRRILKLGRNTAARPNPESPTKRSEELSGGFSVTPRDETLAPDVYESRPYTCIVIVPGGMHEDIAIHDPGNSWSRQRVIKPELRFIPRNRSWPTNGLDLSKPPAPAVPGK